jgi:hypothetical protein
MEPGQIWWYRLYLRTIVKGTIRPDTLRFRKKRKKGVSKSSKFSNAAYYCFANSIAVSGEESANDRKNNDIRNDE